MKKILSIVILAVLLLVACSPENKQLRVEQNGYRFVIDLHQQQIRHGEDVYSYEDSGSRVTVTYPNGATYYQDYLGAEQTFGHSPSYNPARYISGKDLVQLVLDNAEEDKDTGNPGNLAFIPTGILACLLGIWQVVAPDNAWRMGHLLTVERGELTDIGRMYIRLAGVIEVIMGAVLLILAIRGL